LVKVAKYLKASPDAWQKMRIDGHADKRGRLEYNMKLSRTRAERVLRELTRLGVPGGKLAAEGYGPTRPIDTAEDLEAYALNRRVELWIDGVTNPEATVRDLNELQ
jgi:outer membrane protein OmpA-like peptidoglycan-associated protein